MALDHGVAALLLPLAIWVLINAADDLFIDLAAIAGYWKLWLARSPQERLPSEAELDAVAERPTAIFVALWREHKVIRRMLERNIPAVAYSNVHFFIGTYPNDAPTQEAVREVAARFPNLHVAVCPHNGPTSKADCLNWIYQRMLLEEEQLGFRFETVLTHDAEDVIDPDALRWINYYGQWDDFVQIPVLSLPRRLRDLVGGVYCDEFAECEIRDMIARQLLGGFIPSNGVGTGYSRRALEQLAERHSNRIFEPAALTEDYENGLRIHELGLPQKFVPVMIRKGRPLATREFFPNTLRDAVRQRSRWILGIALQSWEFHSLRDTMGQIYWFWRDRKGILGNLATPLLNLTFLYGLVTWILAVFRRQTWGLASAAAPIASACVAGLALQGVHMVFRIWCSSRIYGIGFGCAAPARVVVANWLNAAATVRALWQYAGAKLSGAPLRWVKTEHAYPNRAALMAEHKRLGEILVGSGWLSTEALDAALASKPETRRLGEHLMQLGLLAEPDLYAALALQTGLPLGKPQPVSIPATRMLPAAMSRKWRVLPFRVAAGELWIVGADLPGEELHRDVRRFSSLEIRFHLVTPTEYEELAQQYLG
jgi:adsorption protein B